MSKNKSTFVYRQLPFLLRVAKRRRRFRWLCSRDWFFYLKVSNHKANLFPRLCYKHTNSFSLQAYSKRVSVESSSSWSSPTRSIIFIQTQTNTFYANVPYWPSQLDIKLFIFLLTDFAKVLCDWQNKEWWHNILEIICLNLKRQANSIRCFQKIDNFCRCSLFSRKIKTEPFNEANNYPFFKISSSNLQKGQS